MGYHTPWHKASFDRFLHERLPQLLAERLPLVGYHVASTGRYTCRVQVTLSSADGDVALAYDGLAQPDDRGILAFDEGGAPYVVVPTASEDALDVAEIRCVGEQLYGYVQARLGQAPPDLPWDAELARSWLQLDVWIADFYRETAHPLDATNWLSRQTHLRRLVIPGGQMPIAAGQRGRACPFETPEGPNLGRVLTIAMGAEIRDGRLVIVDERPEASLGLSASAIPMLEHDDPNRLLMGSRARAGAHRPRAGRARRLDRA
jgi:hypothetical protein